MSADLVLEGTLVEGRTPEQWASVIRAELAQAAAGFVAAGEHLTQAKAQMKHGEWLPWIEREMPVSADTVQRLMAIAQNAALVKAANTEHVRYLPPSWGTLYELSRLDPPLLEAAIQAGDIHAELERKGAGPARPGQRRRSNPQGSPHWGAPAEGAPVMTALSPRDPRSLGAAIGHRLKAQPITPEKAAKVAALVMSGVPQKRGEGDAPAA